MEREKLTEFTGIAGAVLRRSISGGSLATGMVLGFVLLLGNWALMINGADKLAAAFSQVVIAAALARFAVNGLFGEWGGTVFSGAGGPWTKVAAVAARYLSLSAIWLLPLILLGRGAPQVMPGDPTMMLAMMGPALAVIALYLLAAALTPPVFLVVSVAAEEYTDTFSPQHWRRQFSGRLGDLFAIYVVYTGALAMVLLLGLPVVMLASAASSKLGLFVGALVLSLLFGVSLNLLGRLCGFFACGEAGLEMSAGEVPSATDGPAPILAEDPYASPVRAPAGSAAPPRAIPVSRDSMPGPSAASQAVKADALDGPTALLDAKPKVEAAQARFVRDPEGAIEDLEALRREFLPHPQVLHALALCLYRSGKADLALDVAEEAIPLSIERGQTRFAAELFMTMRANLHQLDLAPDTLIAIGGALSRSKEWIAATKAYSTILSADALDVRAIKGMLQVAEGMLERRENPEGALKIYRFLARRCAASPLADYIRRGLEETERTLAPTV